MSIVCLGDMLKRHNGKKFTTLDQDNDLYQNNCAVLRAGSWWYDACTDCDLTRSGKQQPYWGNINPAAKSVMMIRRT